MCGMKNGWIGLLAVLAAFLGGMKFQQACRAPDRNEQTESSSMNTRTGRMDGPARQSMTNKDAERLRNARIDEVAAAVRPVLTVGPKIDRLKRFLSMLDGMTPENWQEMLSAMSEETSRHGRFQQEEWDLALRQAGRLDGANAARIYAEKGQDESLRKVLAGWAQTDPEAAWKWLGQYKDEKGRRDVWRGALVGIAELDPTEAMRRLNSLPFEVKGGTISFLVGPMVQAEGIDATADRIKQIYADCKAKDPSTVSDKEKEFVYAFFHNVCDIKRNAGYSPEKRMEALELLAEFPDLAMSSPWLIPRTVTSAANDDPRRTMEIVEKMTVSDGTLLSSEGAIETAKVWIKKDPAGFEEWLRANPENPAAIEVSKLPR